MITLGTGLVSAGCALVPTYEPDTGTAQATITYQDESGTQQSHVAVHTIHCDVTRGQGSFLTIAEETEQLVVATVAEGESLSLSIALGHDGLVFHSQEPFNVSDDGSDFSDLPGGVARSEGGEGTVVDLEASATGTITCP